MIKANCSSLKLFYWNTSISLAVINELKIYFLVSSKMNTHTIMSTAQLNSKKILAASFQHSTRKFQCDSCTRRFFYKILLEQHQKTHSATNNGQRNLLKNDDKSTDSKAVKQLPPIRGMCHIRRRLINCCDCGQKFKTPASFATHCLTC